MPPSLEFDWLALSEIVLFRRSGEKMSRVNSPVRPYPSPVESRKGRSADILLPSVSSRGRGGRVRLQVGYGVQDSREKLQDQIAAAEYFWAAWSLSVRADWRQFTFVSQYSICLILSALKTKLHLWMTLRNGLLCMTKQPFVSPTEQLIMRDEWQPLVRSGV